MNDMPRATSLDVTAYIPDELFIFVIDHLGLKPDLIHVSHVSRRWRTLARAHPTFWKSIPLRDDGESGDTFAYDLARAQILASNNVGVTIGIHIHRTSRQWKNFPDRSQTVQADEEDESEHDGLDSSALLDLTALLAENLNRISKIAVLSTGSAYRLLHIGGLFTTMAPLLDRLEMAVSGEDEDHIASCVFNWSYLDRFAPRLRVLRLYDVDVDSPGLTSESSPHHSLEKLVWRMPLDTIGAGPPRLDDVLAQFPSLSSLELFWDSEYVPAPSMQDISSRLATFKRIMLTNAMIHQVKLTQLGRVPFIAVHDPASEMIQSLLEHFRVGVGHATPQQGISKLPELHLDLWPYETAAEPQRMEVCELSSEGRVRAFDIISYTWLPSISELAALSSRVTRLSIPVREWREVILCLNDATAVQELVLRFNSEEKDYYLKTSTTLIVAQCADLRAVTLQAAKTAHELGVIEVELDAEFVMAAMKRMIDERVHGRIELRLEGISLSWKDQTNEQERERIWRSVFSEIVLTASTNSCNILPQQSD